MPDGREPLAVKVLSSLSQLSAAEWDACAGTANPFVSHAFLLALEESGSATAETGWLGQHRSKKLGLSWIYLLRALAITALLLAPKGEWTIYLFSAAMGLLWLSTVPLTTGIVGQVFGLRYLATLFGIVFFSHQLGSFSGVWLGGYLYDSTGSYDTVWWAGVLLGLLAAAIHLPINERPLARLGRPETEAGSA